MKNNVLKQKLKKPRSAFVNCADENMIIQDPCYTTIVHQIITEISAMFFLKVQGETNMFVYTADVSMILFVH